MSDVTILGLPPSTYVRTAQLVCANKGVAHTLQPVNFRSDDYLAEHPFRKMPALHHGAVRLYEALAIAVYLDEAFDGRALQPSGAAERAQMMQWISITNDYVYKSIIGGCVAERFIKPMRGLDPDEAAIAATVPAIETCLDVLDAGVTEEGFLCGGQVTLADLFVGPILTYFAATPEGAAHLPERAALSGWLERMGDTPGYSEINTLGG